MVDISNGTISLYTVEDRNGEETSAGYFEDHRKAEEYAQSIDGMVIEQEFTWEDSNLLTDYRQKCDKCDEPITDANDLAFDTHKRLAERELDDGVYCDPCAEGLIMAHDEENGVAMANEECN